MVEGSARTNNNAKSEGIVACSSISATHSSLWRFLDKIRTAQKGRDVDYTPAEIGATQTKKRAKYVTNDERILTIDVPDYENRSTLEYLRAIAHNL
jgi:hypothetical protein